MKKEHFTLTELIVVLAVIAILMLLGSPYYKHSQEIAEDVTCKNNIRQISYMTELYRKDHSSLPYSKIWQTDFSSGKATINDFSFIEQYTSGNLDIFTCPSSEDESLNNMSDLKNKSSYYYVPGAYYLSQLILDSQFENWASSPMYAYSGNSSAIIFDNNLNNHNGAPNIVELFPDDGNTASTSSSSTPQETSLPPSTNGDPTPPDFDVDDDTITINGDAIVNYQIIGSAISYGGRYDMAVTTQFQITDPYGSTSSAEMFGDYSSATSGNVNNGAQQSYTPDDIYEAGTTIVTEATSWKKTSTSKSGNKDSHWTEYMEVDDHNSTNTMILVNGDPVPNIDGYLDQGNVESFLNDFIDDEGNIVLEDNEVIILFELGTTNMDSSAADFQDLVILVTMTPTK